MSYKYDIFISYRRHGEWPDWVKEKFLPIFYHWIGEELGRDVRIFFDQNVESGTSWPNELAYALAHSKVLVPLWSRQYFNSNWCKAELSHMLMREKECGFRTPNKPTGLIIPATIHDGQDLPKVIRSISYEQLQECTNIRMAKNSSTEEELSRKICRWAPSIVKAICEVPPHDLNWASMTYEDFSGLYETSESKQYELPSLG